MKTNNSLRARCLRAKTTLLLAALTTLLFGMAQAASTNSLSELLEKGIYSEETKGDLDGAMQLYKQVVAEGKAGQAVAAQAQYRLGVCQYKKKNYAEANAAFEKLIKDYPDQKELVSKARDYLASAVALLPPPWVDGEALQLDIKFPTGFKIGTVIYSVRSGELNGRKIWRPSARTFAGVQSFSRVEVEADSFKPIHSRWKHTLIGDVDTTYGPTRAELKSKGKSEIKTVDLDGVIYDNEEAIQLMRRLPLVTNYHMSARVLSSLGGGNIVPVGLDVAAVEKVTVPAGTFECYRVELNIRQTFWYTTDEHRYLVKFEGGGVIAELSKIGQVKPGEPVVFQDGTFNVSVTLPSDWNFYRPEADDSKAKLAVHLLDPEATGTSELFVTPLDNLKPEQKKSLQDWVDSEIADGKKSMKDLQVQPGKERTLAGRPALSLTGEYTDGKDKKTVYAVFRFGETNATEFRLTVPTEDFESFRPAFDAVVDSYKAR